MKSSYEIAIAPGLSCKKDTFCEKTANYMEALATAEFNISKMTKACEHSHQIIKIKDEEILVLRRALAKKVDDKFKEIRHRFEVEKLKNQVNELLQFKKHYEHMLIEMEAQIKIDQEIQQEIELMGFEKEKIVNIDNYINENLFLTKEEYDAMTSY